MDYQDTFKYTFYGDNYEELWRIQKYLNRYLELEKKIIWATNQVFLCSCKNIGSHETIELIKRLKEKEGYSSGYYTRANTLIAALYRYLYGDNQLELFPVEIWSGTKEHYQSIGDFSNAFKKPILQWKHFLNYENFYIETIERLVRYSEFIRSSMTVYFNDQTFPYSIGDRDYVPLEETILNILGIKTKYLYLDFSNYKKDNYDDWSKLSHPLLFSNGYNSNWHDSDYIIE